MRYRWDPAYPMGRRDMQAYDASMRASDDERNAVADKLSRHYAEGRLDEVEFKNRLDTAMSATTRGDLNGLFDDLPRLPSEPPPPPPRHRRILPWVFVVVLVGHRGRRDHALLPALPRAVVPLRRRRLLLVAPGGWAPATPTSTTATRAGGPARSWTTEAPSWTSIPIAPRIHRSPHARAPARPAHAHRSPQPDRQRSRDRGRSRARCAPWSSSPASPTASSTRSPLAAPSPPRTRGRWSRPRTCRSGCGTSSRAATPSCSATARRSGCSGGVTPGRSTRSSTSCGPPSPSWRSRPSRCSP